ncbi:MAG: PAS domain S-box protein [Leptospiraceae bacterium]|nr:PAS domain S-box protein [Leptospiraceae bacterium]
MDQEKPKILYVDDEPLNLSSFKYLYKRYYNIYLADSAMEGFKILEKENIKVVIADQRMPEVTGIEFLEKVASIYPHTIKIMLTGYSNSEETILAINRGEVYRYVTKPFNELDFKITIDKALEVYELKMKNHKLLEALEEKIKERTRELFDSEERYRAIFSNATASIVLVDKRGNFLQMNSAWAKMTGYNPEELKKLTIFDLTYEDDIKIFKRYFNLLISKQIESFQLEKRYLKKGGIFFWAEISTSLIFSSINNQENILAIIHDITERKKAEETLNENGKELRQLNQKLLFYFQETPLAYMELNINLQIINWNPAAEKIFGYNKGEILGKNISQKLISEHFRLQFDNYITNLILDKEAKNFVAANTRKDGKEIICDWYNTTLVNEEGVLIGFACLALDITERIRAEKEIISTNRALREAKEEAEKANKIKSEFLANMSHEIRTPMNAIIGFTELLDNMITDDVQKQYLSSIVSSSKTLLTLINDILDLSKVEAGKLKLNYGVVNLQQLLEELKSVFSKSIYEKGLEFQFNIEPNLPHILLDEIRLRQILINLIGNSVKFTSSGFIKLSVRTQKNPLQKNSLELYISIQDTGTGIPKEEQEMIFEAFSQRKEQNQAKYGGTGLGLTISSRLAKMMGGKILLESNLNLGSTFTVFFQEIQVEESYQTQYASKQKDYIKPNFKGISLLMVDDIESNKEVLRGYLRGTEIEIFEASNGKEAIEIAISKHPNLIVLDIRMPVMNGYEALKILKAKEDLKNIPVIALTASVADDERLKKEFDGYLRKPVNRTDFILEIQKHIQKSTPAKESLFENVNSENISNVIELYTILTNKLIKDWNNCKEKLIFSDIESFSLKLKDLGSKYTFHTLISLGDKLEKQTKMFDIVSLPYTLEEFPLVIEKIKRFIDEFSQL